MKKTETKLQPKRGRVLLTGAVLLVVLSLPLSAHAKRSKTPAVKAKGTTATSSYKRKTKIDFTKGDAVYGTRAHGAGTVVGGERKAKLPTMVVIRRHFRRELIKSAENI